MAGEVFDSRNFEQIHFKMPGSKNIFLPKSIPHKMCLNYILLKVFFIKKRVVLGDFQSKSKSIHLFVVVFLCIPASWESEVFFDSQATNRSGPGG
jgi:hypothetical protein